MWSSLVLGLRLENTRHRLSTSLHPFKSCYENIRTSVCLSGCFLWHVNNYTQLALLKIFLKRVYICLSDASDGAKHYNCYWRSLHSNSKPSYLLHATVGHDSWPHWCNIHKSTGRVIHSSLECKCKKLQ